MISDIAIEGKNKGQPLLQQQSKGQLRRKNSFSISPCSLEMSGLYQNLDVSWTNLTFRLLSGLPSETKLNVTFEINQPKALKYSTWTMHVNNHKPMKCINMHFTVTVNLLSVPSFMLLYRCFILEVVYIIRVT